MTFIIIFSYILILIIIGIFQSRRIKNFDDFMVAGRRQGTFAVTASLLATCIGASATFGVVDMAYNIGFPAFWWLGSGALGLVILSFIGAEKIYKLKAHTLPDTAKVLLGESTVKPISVIITVGWTAIIAAQYVAAAKILGAFLDISFFSALFIAFLVITLYSTLGGQLSVIKTDIVQAFFLIGGFFLALIILYNNSGSFIRLDDIVFINKSFGLSKVGYFLLIVATPYIIGPDIFTRLFSAKDEKTAKKALRFSAVLLIFVSVLITAVGIWAKYNLPSLNGNVLMAVIKNTLPDWAIIIAAVALFSAVVSSADTCLLSVSGAFEKNIISSKRIGGVRFWTFLFGFLAFLVTLWKQDIIGLLLAAYKIFAGGVIAPMIIALIFYGKRKMIPKAVNAAIIFGGSLGLMSVVLKDNKFAVLGFAVSGIIALLSLRKGK